MFIVKTVTIFLSMKFLKPRIDSSINAKMGIDGFLIDAYFLWFLGTRRDVPLKNQSSSFPSLSCFSSIFVLLETLHASQPLGLAAALQSLKTLHLSEGSLVIGGLLNNSLQGLGRFIITTKISKFPSVI